jgi:hypothetical protein
VSTKASKVQAEEEEEEEEIQLVPVATKDDGMQKDKPILLSDDEESMPIEKKEKKREENKNVGSETTPGFGSTPTLIKPPVPTFGTSKPTTIPFTSNFGTFTVDKGAAKDNKLSKNEAMQETPSASLPFGKSNSSSSTKSDVPASSIFGKFGNKSSFSSTGSTTEEEPSPTVSSFGEKPTKPTTLHTRPTILDTAAETSFNAGALFLKPPSTDSITICTLPEDEDDEEELEPITPVSVRKPDQKSAALNFDVKKLKVFKFSEDVKALDEKRSTMSSLEKGFLDVANGVSEGELPQFVF